MDLIRRPLRFCLLWVEGALDHVFGPAWNPFYKLGALGYFYYWVVLASGIYLFLFFKTGLTEAYGSVEYLTHEQWWLGGVMRSLHRYASDALVAMMLLHLAREFAYDRYRGHRWYSWITGTPILWLVFIAGITGYWLVWDMLAQYVALVTTEWLDWLPFFGEPIARNFMAPSHLDDRFFTLMVFLHIAVPLILIFLLWFHLHRVNHARVNPPRGLAVGTFLMLLALSIIKPAESHPPADLSAVPTVVALDWFYLWAFPLVDLLSPAVMWTVAVGGSFLLLLLPWLPPKRRKPEAVVSLDNCNGCGRCAADCPFNAIDMGRRTDGSRFERQAVVNPSVCASCGICVGSCPTATPFRRVGELIPGIDLPHLSLARLRALTDAAAASLAGGARILVFGCEYGANAGKLALPGVGWVAMPCTAMLPPSFIDYVLSQSRTDGVAIQSCSEGHCYYRLGVRWTDARLEGRRDPRLRARVPRERMLRVTAGPTEWRRLERELLAFQQRLRQLRREPTQPARGAEPAGAVSVPGPAS